MKGAYSGDAPGSEDRSWATMMKEGLEMMREAEGTLPNQSSTPRAPTASWRRSWANWAAQATSEHAPEPPILKLSLMKRA